MIWPILLRYLMAFAAGFTWAHSGWTGELPWAVALIALASLDVRRLLRRTRIGPVDDTGEEGTAV